MYPGQLKAICYVEEGVSLLTANLMDDFNLEEADALEIVAGLDDVTDKLQEGKIKELYETAKKRYAGVVNARENPKKELYPGHPQYMAPITTEDTFNAHMAQAMTPYILSIAKKIAKDRGIENPNEAEIQMVLKNINWASAAYEAKEIPRNPSFPRIRAFFKKYVFDPLGKATNKVPFDIIFGLAGAGTMTYMLWATFHKNVIELGMPPVSAYQKYTTWKQKRVKKQVWKKYGLKYGR